MDLDSIGRFISQVGFPISVAAYLLIRTEPTLKAINLTLVALKTLIEEKLK
jgi:hypothetical protein